MRTHGLAALFLPVALLARAAAAVLVSGVVAKTVAVAIVLGVATRTVAKAMAVAIVLGVATRTAAAEDFAAKAVTVGSEAGISEAQVFEWWDDGIIDGDEAREILDQLEVGNMEEACMLASVYALESCNIEGGYAERGSGTAARKVRKKTAGKGSKVDAKNAAGGSEIVAGKGSRTEARNDAGSGADGGEFAAGSAEDGGEFATGSAAGERPGLAPHGFVKWSGRTDSTGHLESSRRELQVDFYRYSLRLGSQSLLTYRNQGTEAHFGEISTKELHSGIPLDTLWGTALLYPVGAFRFGALLDTALTTRASVGYAIAKGTEVEVAYWHSPEETFTLDDTITATDDDAADDFATGCIVEGAGNAGCTEESDNNAASIDRNVTSCIGEGAGNEAGCRGEGAGNAAGCHGEGAETLHRSEEHSVMLQGKGPWGSFAAWWAGGVPLLKIQLRYSEKGKWATVSWKGDAYFHGDSLPRHSRLSSTIVKNRFWGSETVAATLKDRWKSRGSVNARLMKPLTGDSTKARFKVAAETGPAALRGGGSVTCLEAAAGKGRCRENDLTLKLKSSWKLNAEAVSFGSSLRVRHTRGKGFGEPRIEAKAVYTVDAANRIGAAAVFPKGNPGRELRLRTEAEVGTPLIRLGLAATFRRTAETPLHPLHGALSVKMNF